MIDETNNHARAVEVLDKAFVNKHMARIRYTSTTDNATAVLYTLAGESLQRCRPFASFSKSEQVHVIISKIATSLLEEFNRERLSVMPTQSHINILKEWLGYRTDPKAGNIYSFIKDECGINPSVSGFSVKGEVFPNPYAFSTNQDLWGNARPIDALRGSVHGDLNTHNIIVQFTQYHNELENFFLIDFANYSENTFILYDHAYFEFSNLIQHASRFPMREWLEFWKVIARVDVPEVEWVPLNLAGSCAIVRSMRLKLSDWIRDYNPSLTDDFWGLYRLAAIAVGLNFCNKKGLAKEERLIALLYAATYLREHCEYFQISSVEPSGELNAFPEELPLDAGAQWESFIDACHCFDNSRVYILVAGSELNKYSISLEPFGRVKWSLVLDFDENSLENGFYSIVHEEIEGRQALHLVTSEDHVSLNPSNATYWFMARGLRGRQNTFPDNNTWLAWKQKYSNPLGQIIRGIAIASGERPTTLVILLNDPLYVGKICDLATEAFGDRMDIVFASGNLEPILETSEQYGAKPYPINPNQIAAGLSKLFRRFYFEKDIVVMIGKDGQQISLKRRDTVYLEEEMTLVHLGVGIQQQENQDILSSFLRGATISWFELGLHKDVDRNKTSQIIDQLEADLKSNIAVRFNLYHYPGAGGTTLARRIAWNLHEKHPTVLLHHVSSGTIGRLQLLRELTGTSILVIVETSEVSLDKIEELYSSVKIENLAVAFLIVDRRFTPLSEEKRTRYLREQLDFDEAVSFAEAFGQERKNKIALFRKIAASDDLQKLRVPFYFGLTAYEGEFKKIESYVEARIEGMSDVEKKIMVYLAMAYRFAHQPIPAQFFSRIIGLESELTVHLERALQPPRQNLLVRETKNGETLWRPTHVLIANQVLEQALSGSAVNRDSWRESLSMWAIQFIEYCDSLYSTSSRVPSERVIDLLIRLFILRDSRDPAWSYSNRPAFSRLISELSPEGNLSVLEKLANKFHEQPHFWGHLGRLLSWRKEHAAALEAIEKALELDATDHVLQHMKGMAIRNQAYASMVEAEHKVESDEEKGMIVQNVKILWKQAEDSFSAARSLAPDNAHPFISHIQLLTKEIEFGFKLFGQGDFSGFLSNPHYAEYQDKIEIAESLLDQVRSIQEGEGQKPDRYLINCEQDINEVIGNYATVIQEWKRQLSQSVGDKSSIRRRLVWAYLGKGGRLWDNLSENELEDTVTMMEQNILTNPEDEKSIRLWFQAARRLSSISIDAAIERLGYLYSRSSAVDLVYYLYSLYSIKAIDGSVLSKEMAEKYLDESRQKARNLKYKKRSYNWYGKGDGMNMFVHYSRLGSWDKSKDFWMNVEPLQTLTGLITRMDRPESGLIELPCGLKAFFVPGRSKDSDGTSLKRERHENKPVRFLLGFSYDGLRAWSVDLIE